MIQASEYRSYRCRCVSRSLPFVSGSRGRLQLLNVFVFLRRGHTVVMPATNGQKSLVAAATVQRPNAGSWWTFLGVRGALVIKLECLLGDHGSAVINARPRL